MNKILLSNQGGDRATAYAMSNKIVSVPEGYLCTWIDSQRQNQWAIVDSSSEKILCKGPLGCTCVDNHCGAALVADLSGKLHAITGGHQSPFEHYVFASEKAEWTHITTLDVEGTYPNVTSDSNGNIHLTYRSPGDRWILDYCRFENNQWTVPQSLVMADKPGYIYWTNGLAVGPEDCIYLTFGNTRVLECGELNYDASYIVSKDRGNTWCNSSGNVLSLPVPAKDLPLMMEECSEDRIQSVEDQKRYNVSGPRSVNYRQMLLSNPVIDRTGALHVILHNGLTGTAELLTFMDGKMMKLPLTDIAIGSGSGKRIHMQSSLSIGPADQLNMVLMVDSTEECVWGSLGTYIVHIKVKTDGSGQNMEQLTVADEDCAQWLPALEHPNRSPLDHVPPLLYTKGVNAGGFSNNKNEVETEVYLCLSDR